MTVQSEKLLANIRAELGADTLNRTESSLVRELLNCGQEHLFHNWDKPGQAEEQKKHFINELVTSNQSYPGGLAAYVKNAKRLLSLAKENKNPFEGFQPVQPETVDLSDFGDDYSFCEKLAINNLEKIAIILVAGGLGERLGYPGIKINIPFELITNTTYIQHYASVILAMQSRSTDATKVPFIIMTSRDTHDKTLETLYNNNFFGLTQQQVTILKQELVPAIVDNEGHIALEAPYSLTLKPHGHGDIHMLMHMSNTANRLLSEGKEYLLFIQDTNAQVFNAAFAAVGASIQNSFDFNSVAVNRVPGEAVGAIAKLQRDDKDITINVEYNQLDPLLRSTISPEGDIPNSAGFSIFPGNINVLVAKLSSYCNVLKDSEGIIAEFVNPKYTDETRTKFKKPTRLETMMQDLPKLYDKDEKVGVTVFNRKWCFSPNKNNLNDAQLKHANGGPPESGATAESDFYLSGRLKLILTGNKVTEHAEELLWGIPFTRGPRVILSPSFALTIDEARAKLRNIDISDEATLILDGKNISIDGLTMSGSSALVVRADDAAIVKIKDKHLSNAGFQLELIDPESEVIEVPAYIKIRGYTFNNVDAEVYAFKDSGTYQI